MATADPGPRMAKIIICCDGTSNSEFINGNPITNVSRISRLIRPVDDGGHRQIVLYLPGIGTDSWNPLSWLKQAVGKGLDELILEAYTFICHNYTAENDDQIMLLGFSRGAFAMRCLADFISDRGLLTKTSLYLLPIMYRKWKSRQPNGDDVEGIDYTDAIELPEAVAVDEQKNRRVMRIIKPVKIKVCALWDTVASINFPLRDLNWVHSEPPAGIEKLYQAISLHERRKYFLPIVMRRPVVGAPHLQQCWFSGYHGDIGGGNEKEVLAHFALAWMISRLQGLVTFDESTFWYWSSNRPTWCLPPRKVWKIPLPWVTAKLSVPDTLTVPWRPLGIHYRHPRLQFWNDAGTLEQVPPGQLKNELDAPADQSKEKMHESVRFLTTKKVFKQCRSLKGITPSEYDRLHWFWKLSVREEVVAWWKRLWRSLRRQTVLDVDYKVWEQRLDASQKTMLNRWLRGEHRRLYGDPEAEVGGEEPEAGGDEELEVGDGEESETEDDEGPQAGDASPRSLILDFRAWLQNPLVEDAPEQS